jgi:hypothetical protein
MTVAKEISKYKLDLVGVQVRWDRRGTEPACEYTFFFFFCGKENENHQSGIGCLVRTRIISAVTRVALVMI